MNSPLQCNVACGILEIKVQSLAAIEGNDIHFHIITGVLKRLFIHGFNGNEIIGRKDGVIVVDCEPILDTLELNGESS